MQSRREFLGTPSAATALMMIGKLPASDLPKGFTVVRGQIGLYTNSPMQKSKSLPALKWKKPAILKNYPVSLIITVTGGNPPLAIV